MLIFRLQSYLGLLKVEKLDKKKLSRAVKTQTIRYSDTHTWAEQSLFMIKSHIFIVII